MLGSPMLAPTRSFNGELLDWPNYPDYYVAFDATRCLSRAAGRARVVPDIGQYHFYSAEPRRGLPQKGAAAGVPA